MIIEHVHLKIKPEQSQAFEAAFKQAKECIYPMSGLNAVQLIKHIQDEHRYILLVFGTSLKTTLRVFASRLNIENGKHYCIHFMIRCQRLNIISRVCS